MTINGPRPFPASRSAESSPRALPEDQLQAYVRRLHEANSGQMRDDGEPPRGRDPWLGLAL